MEDVFLHVTCDGIHFSPNYYGDVRQTVKMRLSFGMDLEKVSRILVLYIYNTGMNI